MRGILSKKLIIMGLLIAIYVIALPLTLHFSGAFKKEKQPDLKQLFVYQCEYKNLTDNEKTELLDSIGFDIQSFEEGGFEVKPENIRAFSQKNIENKISYLRIVISDDETHFIEVTIYMPEEEGRLNLYAHRYERREINGKPIGFFDYSDSQHQQQIIRYHDEQTGCVYIIEPFLGFNDIEYTFLDILI